MWTYLAILISLLGIGAFCLFIIDIHRYFSEKDRSDNDEIPYRPVVVSRAVSDDVIHKSLKSSTGS